jgi:hypothetical protein
LYNHGSMKVKTKRKPPARVPFSGEPAILRRIGELKEELRSLGYRFGGPKRVMRSCPGCGAELSARELLAHKCGGK